MQGHRGVQQTEDDVRFFETFWQQAGKYSHTLHRHARMGPRAVGIHQAQGELKR
jgi:hypothetical protein